MLPYGDSALLVVARGGGAEEQWRTVQALAELVEGAGPDGVENVVATFDAVLVEFDFLRTTYERLRDHVTGLADAAVRRPPPRRRRLFRIPVAYGGEHGPDLEAVAAELGLTPEELVARHAAATWTIRFLGGPTGTPVHDGSPFERSVPRCAAPRTRVPGGSVALAGRQGVVYPMTSPGGWRLIGRTPWRLVDFDREPFAYHRPGDLIRFHPVPHFDPADRTPSWTEADE